MNKVTYVVEKYDGQVWGQPHYIFVGEFDTNAAVAEALKISPAKLRNQLSFMRVGKWNHLNNVGYAGRMYIKEVE